MTRDDATAQLAAEQSYLFSRVYIRGENGEDVAACRATIRDLEQWLATYDAGRDPVTGHPR